MFYELEIYKSNDHFFFKASDELSEVCNAPKNGIGIYVVYALKNGKVKMVYVGAAGKIGQNGHIKTEASGLYETFALSGQAKSSSPYDWKKIVKAESIEALDIYWYETFDKEHTDIPSMVLGNILQSFYLMKGELPLWNKEY